MFARSKKIAPINSLISEVDPSLAKVSAYLNDNDVKALYIALTKLINSALNPKALALIPRLNAQAFTQAKVAKLGDINRAKTCAYIAIIMAPSLYGSIKLFQMAIAGDNEASNAISFSQSYFSQFLTQCPNITTNTNYVTNPTNRHDYRCNYATLVNDCIYENDDNRCDQIAQQMMFCNNTLWNMFTANCADVRVDEDWAYIPGAFILGVMLALVIFLLYRCSQYNPVDRLSSASFSKDYFTKYLSGQTEADTYLIHQVFFKNQSPPTTRTIESRLHHFIASNPTETVTAFRDRWFPKTINAESKPDPIDLDTLNISWNV